MNKTSIGIPGKTRTFNLLILSQAPLPIGLRGHTATNGNVANTDLGIYHIHSQHLWFCVLERFYQVLLTFGDILDFVSVPSTYSVHLKGLATLPGLEPGLSAVTGRRFSQLNYRAMISVGRHPRTNLYTESAYRR